MRKIKKINGFLVVKFNDREKREYEGTALGEYGVIDAEVYTGNLDIDRGAMEYDDADTLEVAVELARGLESEEDITGEPPTYTAAVETNESYTEETVEPAALIEGWTRRLATRVKSKHYPDTDPRTAAHELYGFKMALHQIGFLPESEVITDPDTFGAGRLDGPMPRNPEELLAFVCDERCKNRAGHTQEELDTICAKCPLGQLYEDAEAQDLRIRERSERALREHIEGVRRAEDTVTALLGGHEALAYLDGLYDFIRGSEFLLLFSDEEGYILYARGDEDISRTARENGLVKGACRSESRLGTNGIGTVLVDRIPLQVFGAEHYYEVHANWACSGASVFLPDGDIGGVVCLSGMAEHVNDHTLGMVVAAADAISRQLKLKDAYDQLSKSYRNLSAIIETVPTAMCLLDESLHVVAFNTQATRQLALAPAELSGADFLEVLGCGAVTAEDIKTSLSNRTISFERGEGKHTISLSVESTGHQEYVAQIEQLSSLHKRVNNIMGNEAHFRFQDIIGISPAMGEAVRMAKIAAQNDASVFLSGESGTGKELFAQAIHNASSRRRGPFIAVNCGALPKSLIEAELFGYEGGSFTGARRDGCAGKFELANGGTIFLDEIGDMPVDVQITLLRVLQNREVRRIGASKALRIDVRVITATNRDLEQLVDSKVFREDLFYRINVFRINIPSLRERTGDVRQLAGFFLAKYSDIRPGGRVEGFTAEALAMMEAYPWPGNVRQLENSVERAVYLAEGELVTAAELPPEVRAFQGSAPSPAVPAAEGESPSGGEGEDEAARIQDMLHRTHGNVMEAARLLGISRRTLYRKLQRYHIDYSSHRI